jgi:hypothetical protein
MTITIGMVLRYVHTSILVVPGFVKKDMKDAIPPLDDLKTSPEPAR